MLILYLNTLNDNKNYFIDLTDKTNPAKTKWNKDVKLPWFPGTVPPVSGGSHNLSQPVPHWKTQRNMLDLVCIGVFPQSTVEQWKHHNLQESETAWRTQRLFTAAAFRHKLFDFCSTIRKYSSGLWLCAAVSPQKWTDTDPNTTSKSSSFSSGGCSTSRPKQWDGIKQQREKQQSGGDKSHVGTSRTTTLKLSVTEGGREEVNKHHLWVLQGGFSYTVEQEEKSRRPQTYQEAEWVHIKGCCTWTTSQRETCKGELIRANELRTWQWFRCFGIIWILPTHTIRHV